MQQNPRSEIYFEKEFLRRTSLEQYAATLHCARSASIPETVPRLAAHLSADKQTVPRLVTKRARNWQSFAAGFHLARRDDRQVEQRNIFLFRF